MGDLVLIDGQEAIVVGSYNDLYPHIKNSETGDTCFSIIDCGNGDRSAWHGEDQLTFIRRATREDVLRAQEARRGR